MSFSKNSKDASGTRFSCAKLGDKQKERSGNRNLAIYIYISYGRWWLRSSAQSWNTLEREMETKDHSDKVRQRKDDHHHNQVRSTKDRTDQRVLTPLGIRGHEHRKMYRNIETHCNNKNTPGSSWATSTLSVDLGKTLNVTTLENTQRVSPTNEGSG